jgi:enolase
MEKKLKPIIEKVHAREILDSRGFPTVEVEITASGHKSISAVPSGASTGEFEALELRDGDTKRFHGKGVQKAVGNVIRNFGPALIGKDASNQKEIDDLLINIDGTSNKSTFGANASLGISMACSVVSAAFYNKPLYNYLNPESNILPIPMINVLNGGMHADQGSDFQEIMLFPHGAKNFKHSLQMGSEVFHCLKKELKNQGMGTTVGDEGGFAPALRSNDQAIELLLNSIEKAGFNVGRDISLALDVAASSFYKDHKYHLQVDGSVLDTDGMIRFYEELITKYPIVSIEDGLDENDWEGWASMNEVLGSKIQIVGDDLTVTNPNKLQKAIEQGSINSILIKLNQIGTVSETIEAIQLARSNDVNYIISHRSGETEDTFISDLSVAMGGGQIKTGSVCRSDRTAKYNRLLRIEEQIKDARFCNSLSFIK